jgi:DNA-nicking Smr family endonuclease
MSGGRRSRPLRDDERTLWDIVTKSVLPLKRRVVAAAATDADADAGDAPREKPKRRAASAAPPPPPAIAPPKPPPLARLDRRMKQKVARGRHEIDARIDLHGMTQNEAHGALVRFLGRAQRDGARMVLVITGKGARNAAAADPYGERGVLKRQVPLWLESVELRPFIVGFEEAGRRHGGEGAIYVRVRRG